MSEERVVYSIQKTYILNHVLTPEREIVTCNQRIDIPTIEPLTEMKALVHQDEFTKVIPCIELAGESAGEYEFLSGFNLEFETNEGVTVLPVKIDRAPSNPIENPYLTPRFVLVLPRGATGVKSCKITLNGNGKEVQHNFTFGIMPPPYNYDNALFGYLSYGVGKNSKDISDLGKKVNLLKLTTETPTFEVIELPKGAGKQTINIEDGVLFYEVILGYSSSEPTTHKPKITLSGSYLDFPYTLSLNTNQIVVKIDLFTGKITAYDLNTGEIFQQFMLYIPNNGFETLSFENFDDIADSVLRVTARGARVD